MDIIARVYTDFGGKFGVPRQSGLVSELRAVLEFEPAYRNRDAVRGLEAYSHIWLIWRFSKNQNRGWNPTVRPPRLGGNERVGVFASRSPFRPNPIGLSCVKLHQVLADAEGGPKLILGGADLVNGTPVYDIKPYIPYADCKPEATGGFTDAVEWEEALEVRLSGEEARKLPKEKADALKAVLACDPRPAYQRGSQRSYGFVFAGMNVRFHVEQRILFIDHIEKEQKNESKDSGK